MSAPEVTVDGGGGGRIVPWRPHAGPQRLLLACPVQDVLYGGKRGGGKSAGLLMDFAAHAQRDRGGAVGVVFRRSYPELEELEAQSRGFYGPLGWSWKQKDRTWVVPGGGRLKLRFLETDADAELYQGHEYTWQGFDEAGSWGSSKGIDRLAATLRSSKGVRCVRRLTANPGGPGHVWLRKRYILPSAPLTPFVSETGLRAVFIPSGMEDNPSLGPEYERLVRSATFGNEALWQAWRYGNWDIIAGAAFAEWSAEVHVMADHGAPAWWERVAGLDWGFRKGAAVYTAVAPDGRLEVADDCVLERVDAETAGGLLARRWKPFGWPTWIVSSPDMWIGTGAGKTLRESFAAGWEKVTGAPCPMMQGDQRPGQRRVKKILTHEALRWEDVRGPDGLVQPWAMPRVRFHARCRYLIETIPALPVDKDHPEDDIDTTADDHGYDALGFVLAIRPPTSAESKGAAKPKDDVQGPLDLTRENPSAIVHRQRSRVRARTIIRLPRPHEKGITLNTDDL